VCPVCVSVEHYVTDLHKRDEAAGEGVYAVPTGAHVKDNEQVMSSFSTCSEFTSCTVTVPCSPSFYSTVLALLCIATVTEHCL